MDPNALLRLILEDLKDDNLEDARYRLRELWIWIGKGGFTPTDSNWRKIVKSLAVERGITL